MMTSTSDRDYIAKTVPKAVLGFVLLAAAISDPIFPVAYFDRTLLLMTGLGVIGAAWFESFRRLWGRVLRWKA